MLAAVATTALAAVPTGASAARRHHPPHGLSGYHQRNLVADEPGHAAATISQPRQRVGPVVRAEHAGVRRRQRHGRLDAVLGRDRSGHGRDDAPARREDPGGGADRDRVQRRRRLPDRRHPVALPVLVGGRRDQRLEPRVRNRGAHGRDRRRGDLQGPGDRLHAGRPAPVRDRLPQRPGRRVGRRVRAGRQARGVHRPPSAQGLRAVRHPGRRRPHRRHLRRAGRRRHGRRARPRPRVRRPLRHQRHAARPARLARTAQRPWGIARAPKHFGKASGDLLIGNFGTAASTRSTRTTATSRERCAGAHAGRPSGSTASGRWSSATARSARRGRCCSRPARATSRTGCSAPSPPRREVVGR